MVNELEEFKAYTTFPEYKAARKNDPTYMGRFTFPMLLDFKGFQRIFTILARGFLFEDGGNGYDRIDYARRALLAWCSVSTGRMQTQKKTLGLATVLGSLGAIGAFYSRKRTASAMAAVLPYIEP